MAEFEWLRGLRVLDLTTELGTLCVRVLHEYGANVRRVEPPTGDPLRQLPPLSGSGNGSSGESLYWLQMMRGREPFVLDLQREDDRERFAQALGETDVVIESQPLGRWAALGVDVDALREANPSLVWVTISPFGLQGPRAAWQATDLIGMAAGGLLTLCGDRDLPPLRVSVEQAYAQAGLQALAGVLVALRSVRATGRGQLVDVSMQAAVANCLGNARLYYELESMLTVRAGGGRAFGSQGSRLVYSCRDGHVAFARSPDSLDALYGWMVERSVSPSFDPAQLAALPQAGRGMPPTELTAAFEASVERLFAGLSKMEIYEEGQRRGIMTCPVSTPADLLANRQLEVRNYWKEIPASGEGGHRVPGPPVRVEAASPVSTPQRKRLPTPQNDLPLSGIRVADFSWVGVAPCATQQLALFGAEVIRVESARKLDVFRGSGPKRGEDPNASAYWANCNRDKRDMTLDLRHPRGREIALRLIAESDVVVESFTPGFMDQVGLSLTEMRQVNPNIITMSCSMEGSTGPHARFRGFGLVLQATAGFTHFTAWPGRIPVGTGVAYTDWFATHFASFAVLAAIEQRERRGNGTHIDLSQLECCIWGLDAEVLRYTATGTMRPALGNGHESMAPHGVFPTAGEDEWVAVAIRDDRDWCAFREVSGIPGLSDPELETFQGRRTRDTEIQEVIAEWTGTRDKVQVAALLQSRGVPAYPVASMRDVQDDPQLRARGHFWPLEHPELGLVDWDSPAYRLSDTPMRHRKAAPLLGEDNEYVYRQVLGFQEDELVDLIAEGVLD